jgi:hypothetical protein
MRTQAEVDAIIREVRTRLEDRRQATGMDLHVPPDGYVQDDDWLSVIVTPVAPGMRAYQYVEALGELERELRNRGVDHVLLVPAMAD